MPEMQDAQSFAHQATKTAEVFNELFRQLLAVFPALANKSAEDLNEMRRQWLLAFKENGITTVEQINAGMRAGRAGRLEPGICLHLLAKEQAERAAAQGDPEILQSDLSSLLLELLQWGCQDPAQLSWLDLPPATNLAAARRLLTDLSALEGERLSAHGRKMAALGNDPRQPFFRRSPVCCRFCYRFLQR